MPQEWNVETATGRCAETGREFAEGEEFYTVLLEDGESFTRRDYSLDAWKGPPDGAYCFFKSQVPAKKRPKQLLVNNEALVGFFERLGDDEEPARRRFRFVLALILMRKRLLRYDGSAVDDEGEVWEMTLMRDRSSHRVVNPRMTDDQIEAVSGQLGTILHADMGEWAQDTSTDAAAPDDSTNTTAEGSATP